MSEIPFQMSFDELIDLAYEHYEWTDEEADEYLDRVRAMQEDDVRWTLEEVAEEFGVDLDREDDTWLDAVEDDDGEASDS